MLLLGIPLAAIVGGMGTIIGTPANAIAVGELDNKGIGVSFLDWMVFSVPVAVTLTVAAEAKQRSRNRFRGYV